MTRHEIREQVFLALFSLGFHENEDNRELVIRYLDDTAEEKAADLERAEIIQKTLGIYDRKAELDEKIDSVSQGWKTGRMGKAELNILRLALYEIFYDTEVPVKVAINEAVDLTKEYCNDETPAFVNGILAKLVKNE